MARHLSDVANIETKINLNDVATLDVSTAKHGFVPKLPNDATKYLDGEGVFTVPAGSGSGATTALDNLASVAINAPLISDTDNTDDLGSSAKKWKDLYLAGKAIILGIANRIGTATTNDANADTMFSASDAAKKAVVIQAKAAVSVPPFVVQQSDGVAFFQVQSDGGIIVDQRTGAVFSDIVNFKYQGNAQFAVTFNGVATAAVGFNGGGGFFTTDASGNVTGLGVGTFKHLLGNGTSPTVTDNGNADSTIAGKDSFFKVTVGTGVITVITITLGTAFATAPVVNCNGSTSVTIKVTSSTTQITLTHPTGFTGGEVLHVSCGGF